MKLGELLIRESVITQAQLDEALNSQLVYGGSLGTCLVELGYIDERSLGMTLSLAFGIDYAPPEAFYEIAPFAIEAIPSKLAEKNLTVPLGLTKRTLSVAMSDPTNLAAVDELRFATGYSIIPFVAAEVRIYQALERYYQLPRRLRYVRLCDQIEKAVVMPGSSASAAHGYGATKDWNGSLVSGSGQPSQWTSKRGGAATATATLERPAVVPVTLKPNEDPLAGLIDKMCRVKDEALLGQVFLEHLAPTLRRTILFRVKGGAARVWDSRGVSDGPADESTCLQITSEPVFRLLAEQKQYSGPVPPGPSHTGFFDKLNFRPPQDMLLAPAYLNDRLVALLYGDNGAGCGLPKNPAIFARLTDKLALGIGLVEMKRQLREI